MLFDMKQRAWAQLANIPASCVTWSRDEKYLFFESVNVKDPAVYRAYLTTGSVEQLFHITIHEAGARVP